jgi:hypothetical protein
MRRSTLVATAALIAALALAGLPAPAGSRSPSEARAVDLAAFTAVRLASTETPSTGAAGAAQASLRVAASLRQGVTFTEPGSERTGPTSRPSVTLPGSAGGSAWKTPLWSVTGTASFYDRGTTAMTTVPYGTTVRICGAGGCIERVIRDYGPAPSTGRLIDMYRPDFFRICSCGWWTGLQTVTVSVY